MSKLRTFMLYSFILKNKSCVHYNLHNWFIDLSNFCSKKSAKQRLGMWEIFEFDCISCVVAGCLSSTLGTLEMIDRNLGRSPM